MARQLARALEEVVEEVFDGLVRVGNGSVLPDVVVNNRRRHARRRLLDALVSRGSPYVEPSLRREVERLVRGWARAAFAPGHPETERFEVRCAEEHDVAVARDSGDPERLLDALEADYRRRVVRDFGAAEIRGLPTSERVRQSLDDAYVPLFVEPDRIVESDDGNTIVLAGPLRLDVIDLLRNHPRSVIVGAPGSGKSTVARYLACRAASGELGKDVGADARLLPLLVLVRSLETGALTPAALAKACGTETGVVERALEDGRALVIVDGLDESRPDVLDDLTGAIRRLADRHAGVRIVVTSRPAEGVGGGAAWAEGFETTRLAAMSPSDVDDFVVRWCRAAERSIHTDEREADRKASEASADLKARLERSVAVRKLASNPLMCSIVCIVHRFLGQRIPEHRAVLYEKCTDALLFDWDRSKFPERTVIGELDAPQKRKLLEGLAREMHEAKLAEAPEAMVVEQFAQRLSAMGREKADAKTIVGEIRDRSGLLVERRPGHYAFSHLTFQEYFTALDFVAKGEETALADRYEDAFWHEVVALAAGIPTGDADKLVRALLRHKAVAATLLAGACVETAVNLTLATRERVESALDRVVPPRRSEDVEHLVKCGAIAAAPLMRSLGTAGGLRYLWSIHALAQLDFEPALRAVAEELNSHRKLTVFVRELGPEDHLACAAFAARALAVQSGRSPTAQRLLLERIAALPAPAARQLPRLINSFRSETDAVSDAVRAALSALVPPRAT